MDPVLIVGLLVGCLALLYVFGGLMQVNQWETGLRFTLGRFTGRMQPGLNFVFPLLQRAIRIDGRIRNRDLPSQMVITRDNVSASIDAVVYFKVIDPQKAALNLENYELAVRDRAKVVLRDVVGEITLDELLARRDAVADKVRNIVEQFVSRWGLHIELIALQDIQLPAMIQEAIAKMAIAEREKQWVIIKSQGDLESAQNFAQAAHILAASPGAMELRRLEALQNITATGTSKVVFDLAKPWTANASDAAALMAGLNSEGEPQAGAPARAAAQGPGRNYGGASASLSFASPPGLRMPAQSAALAPLGVEADVSEMTRTKPER